VARKLSAHLVKAQEFISLAEYQGQVAREVYESQDDETRKVIDKIVTTLQNHSDGNVYGVDDQYTDSMVMHLAVEAVKDLAVCGIQVANFQFPADICAMCGGEV
jgi:hypothetical protein